jgi:hypothetical protein
MVPPLPLPAVLVLLTFNADSLPTWPLRAGPAGLLTTLRAPWPVTTRPGSRWSRLRCLVTMPTARSHAHGPLARPPQDHVPVRCLASVTVHRSLPPAHARRSRPLMVPSPHRSRLVVTFPLPPHVPWSRPPPTHTANPDLCTRFTVLTGERGSWEPSWRQVRSPEMVRRGLLARLGTLLQALRWSEPSGRRLHRQPLHTVVSPAPLRTGGRAVSEIRRAVEVPKGCKKG